MSKIYEALLRAESDRVAAGGIASEALPGQAHADPPASDVSESDRQRQDQRADLPPFGPGSFDLAQDNAPQYETELLHEQSASRPGPAPPLAAVAREETAGPPADNSSSFAVEPLEAPKAFTPLGVVWKPLLTQLPALQERGSAVEQFRGLRSRLQEFRGLNVLKSLLISSGLPEEGKSYVTANLAISMARYKSSRVLLIDGDMRRGTLHKLLGAPNTIGLAEYLSGQASLNSIMQHGRSVTPGDAMPEGLATLTFISCGAAADNAADLSGNGRFEKLLAETGPVFDWIVVDSSPVNLVADGVQLARACDGVLLVTRGAVTTFKAAQRALSELKAANVLGVVLNAVRKPPAVGGYYGYDSYDTIKP